MDKKVTFEQLDLTPEEAKKILEGARKFLPPLEDNELLLPKEDIDASE